MKYSLVIIFIGCFVATSNSAMMRKVPPLIPCRLFPALIIRNYASVKNPDKNSPAVKKDEDVFKEVKETLGTKSDFFCCAYLGTLLYFYYKFMLPKSAYRYPRSR